MRPALNRGFASSLCRAVFGAALAAQLFGCVSVNALPWGKDRVPVAGPKNPVAQVLAMWQPGTGPGIDGKTTRGFTGQVFFFTANSAIAAKVKGEVSVYVFDDQGTPEDQIKPIHRFVYEADSWEKLGHAGKLGHAYSLFVPYTRPGFHKALCTLKIKFTPEGGLPVYSEMASIGLPGKTLKDPETDGLGDEGEQASSGKSPAFRQTASALETTVPRNLASIDLTQFRKSAPPASPVPLSDAERARILRDMRDREEDVEVADSREPSERAARRRSHRDARVIPAGHSDDWESDESWDEEDSLEARPARLPRESRLGGRPARSLLDDFDDE